MNEQYMTVERWKDPEVRAKSGIIDLFALGTLQRKAELSESERANLMWEGRLTNWGLWKTSW